jgi:hypothetical protein
LRLCHEESSAGELAWIGAREEPLVEVYGSLTLLAGVGARNALSDPDCIFGREVVDELEELAGREDCGGRRLSKGSQRSRHAACVEAAIVPAKDVEACMVSLIGRWVRREDTVDANPPRIVRRGVGFGKAVVTVESGPLGLSGRWEGEHLGAAELRGWRCSKSGGHRWDEGHPLDEQTFTSGRYWHI